MMDTYGSNENAVIMHNLVFPIQKENHWFVLISYQKYFFQWNKVLIWVFWAQKILVPDGFRKKIQMIPNQCQSTVFLPVCQFTLFHTVKKTTLAQKIKKNMLILNQLRSVTFWQKLGLFYALQYTYVSIHIALNCVGIALLALSQFCRLNGKIDKKTVKNNRLFLYVDVFYIKYLLL